MSCEGGHSGGGHADYGQVVVGPPGSGKTAYCLAMKELLVSLGRKVALFNLGEDGNTHK